LQGKRSLSGESPVRLAVPAFLAFTADNAAEPAWSSDSFCEATENALPGWRRVRKGRATCRWSNSPLATTADNCGSRRMNIRQPTLDGGDKAPAFGFADPDHELRLGHGLAAALHGAALRQPHRRHARQPGRPLPATAGHTVQYAQAGKGAGCHG